MLGLDKIFTAASNVHRHCYSQRKMKVPWRGFNNCLSVQGRLQWCLIQMYLFRFLCTSLHFYWTFPPTFFYADSETAPQNRWMSLWHNNRIKGAIIPPNFHICSQHICIVLRLTSGSLIPALVSCPFEETPLWCIIICHQSSSRARKCISNKSSYISRGWKEPQSHHHRTVIEVKGHASLCYADLAKVTAVSNNILILSVCVLPYLWVIFFLLSSYNWFMWKPQAFVNCRLFFDIAFLSM